MRLSQMQIRKEFLNRRTIKHKNIVQAHKLYIDRVKNKIYFIMEYVKGTELLDSVCGDGQYSGKLGINFASLMRLYSQKLLLLTFSGN